MLLFDQEFFRCSNFLWCMFSFHSFTFDNIFYNFPTYLPLVYHFSIYTHTFLPFVIYFYPFSLFLFSLIFNIIPSTSSSLFSSIFLHSSRTLSLFAFHIRVTPQYFPIASTYPRSRAPGIRISPEGFEESNGKRMYGHG